MSKQKKMTIPFRQGLFTEEGNTFSLIGNRCEACGQVFYPPRPVIEYDIVAGGSLGGGGYGDPLERDPSMVMKDLEDGIISHKVARDIYKVAYNEETLLVDEEKTKALREKERTARKKRGIKFETFEKEWLKLKPGQEILEFYGEWPEKHYESFTYYGAWPEVEKGSKENRNGNR
jgi:hypothetical protein